MNRFKRSKDSKIILFVFFLIGMAWLSLSDSPKIVSSAGTSQKLAGDTEPSTTALFSNAILGNLVPNDLADYVTAVAVNHSGAIYVAGITQSPGFPIIHPFQQYYGGGESDGFITVFAPDGQTLLYSTYFGGSGTDAITDLAIGENGRIYLTGMTTSIDFPLANPFQPASGGFRDGFLTVFEPDFTALVFSTYLGGSNVDYPHSVVTGPGGEAHIAGYTDSPNFPTLNPIQTHQGGQDVFITGFAPDGQSLMYSTYIGGSGSEEAFDIALDSNGRKFFTGYTESTNFPIANAYQPTYAGGVWDGYVTILSTDGLSVEMSTFLGGSLPDNPRTIQIGSNNRVYVAGGTQSEDFPLQTPYQPLKNEGWDGFLTIFNPNWQSLEYSSFLGGNGYDIFTNMDVDENGRTYATGYTFSTDFPLMNPYQSGFQGGTDVILTSFASDGQSLFYSTYLGGLDGDVGAKIFLGDFGLAYIAGSTGSTNFPVVNPYQPEITGYADGFVSVMNADGQSLQYSTYLGGSYPGPTDVSLNGVTGTTNNDWQMPSWGWLLSALILFFIIAVLLTSILDKQKE